MLQHLKKYANNKLKQKLAQVTSVGYRYDWDLNIQEEIGSTQSLIEKSSGKQLELWFIKLGGF